MEFLVSFLAQNAAVGDVPAPERTSLPVLKPNPAGSARTLHLVRLHKGVKGHNRAERMQQSTNTA